MTPDTPDLEKLRALAEGATPGPWTACCAERNGACGTGLIWGPDEESTVLYCEDDCAHPPSDQIGRNAMFVAASRAAVPWLLDRVAELERELADERRRREEAEAAQRSDTGELWVTECERARMGREAAIARERDSRAHLEGAYNVVTAQRDAAQRENAIMRKALEQAVSSPDLGALYGIVRAGVRDDAFGQGAREALKALGNIVAEYSKAAREALSSCSPAPAAEGPANGERLVVEIPDAVEAIASDSEAIGRNAMKLASKGLPSPPACERCGRLEGALRALVAEVAQECSVAKGAPNRLAENEEAICGRPARWGIIMAWTCDEHRRERDRNEIGGPALRAAFVALASPVPEPAEKVTGDDT